MCSAASPSGAELECSVLEEDWQRGQSYMAQWHSLTFVPHQDRPIILEAGRSAKHWEAKRLLQRFLSGAISKNDPHPKTYSTRWPDQPIYDSSAMGPKLQQGPVHMQRKVWGVTMRPKGVVLDTSERKTVVKTTKFPRFLG